MSETALRVMSNFLLWQQDVPLMPGDREREEFAYLVSLMNKYLPHDQK